MATTAINFRIDEDMKNEADLMFQSMGMTTSGALTMFIKRFVDDGRFPFTPEVIDPFYSKSNLEYLTERINSANDGNLTEHELIEV